MLKRWKSISCMAPGGSSSSKVSQWVDQPLRPQTGNPLRVFSRAQCTEKKTELVMKGVIGRKSYTVRDMNGVDFFIVERKSLHNWSRRVISDKGGTPICFIDHVPNNSGTDTLMHIWSLEGLEPTLVMEVVESKSRSGFNKRDELRVILQGNNTGARRYLRAGGDLANRIFGVSWTDDPKNFGHMVAVTWDVFGCNYGKEDASDAKYVLEIPAGVDAAAMVALSVCVGERDCPCPPNLPKPIEVELAHPVNAFGASFISQDNDVYLLGKENDSLAVISSTKQKYLTCRENGDFTSLAGIPVFQLTDGAFRAQGTDLSNNPIDVSFLESRGDGSFFRLALQCFSTSSKGCRVVLIAAMKKGQQVVDIELIDKPPRRTGKSGSGLKIDTPRPIIARAVLGSQSPEHFEDWYYDTIDSLFGSSFCIDQPIEHVGIGVEVAGGVDVALIFAAILVTIKYLPASFACAAKCGEIQPRGTRPLSKTDRGEYPRDKSVLAWVEECVDDCRKGDFLLASK